MALWSRKRRRAEEPEPAAGARRDRAPRRRRPRLVGTGRRGQGLEAPGAQEDRPEAPREERDILAEHFGEDWRTNFLYTGPTEEDLEEERRREQQALDDQDPYKVLQVCEDATWDEIVAAHRHQARVHHPDRLFGQSEEEKAEGEERIRVINQAYQELRVRRG